MPQWRANARLPVSGDGCSSKEGASAKTTALAATFHELPTWTK
jgi:hypothetical protein